MQSPQKIADAPGLSWRRRVDHWVAVWIARADIVRRGYEVRTARLWPPTTNTQEPFTDEVAKYLRSECARLQNDMLAWAHGGDVGQVQFVGTMESLIECYRRDPDSPFHNLRFGSKETYGAHLRLIEAQVGKRTLAALKGRDFLRWYEAWSAPESKGGPRHVPRAHARMTMLRILFNFGVAILEDAQCQRLALVLSKMKFENGKPRSEALTADQATAIRRKAHELGYPSMAFAQALQFELMLRPKDVIGEWVPMSEPGISQTTHAGRKWLLGLDWRETTDDLILTHRLSKSIRGRLALADPGAGKIKVWNLKLYPMVVEELQHVASRVGPVIVNEDTGLPYTRDEYRNRWREIADAVGVPRSVQNRDSRAGGVTEGMDVAGDDVEAVRHAAGHARLETTLRYSRAADKQTAKIAVLRAQKRKS